MNREGRRRQEAARLAVRPTGSSLASGNTKVNADGPPFSADCPADGCLGVAFDLAQRLQPKAYQDINEPRKLSKLLPPAAWLNHSLKPNVNDKQCGTPREWIASNFCRSAGRSACKRGRIHQRGRAAPEHGRGIRPRRRWSGARAERCHGGRGRRDQWTGHAQPGGIRPGCDRLVPRGPRPDARHPRAHDQAAGSGCDVPIDAHPLLRDFAEGDPEDVAASAAASVAAAATQSSGLSRASALTPIGGGPRLPFIPGKPPPGGPGPEQDVPGVTLGLYVRSRHQQRRRRLRPALEHARRRLRRRHRAAGDGDGSGGETVVSWDVTDDVLNGVYDVAVAPARRVRRRAGPSSTPKRGRCASAIRTSVRCWSSSRPPRRGRANTT